MHTYQRIRDLREDSDLTQKQVAEKLYMHLTQYRRYESGESEVPLNIAISIADLYDVSLDYIAGRSIHRHGNAAPEFTADEIELIDRFRSLGERDKGKAEMYVQMLSEQSAAALSSKGAV